MPGSLHHVSRRLECFAARAEDRQPDRLSGNHCFDHGIFCAERHVRVPLLSDVAENVYEDDTRFRCSYEYRDNQSRVQDTEVAPGASGYVRRHGYERGVSGDSWNKHVGSRSHGG